MGVEFLFGSWKCSGSRWRWWSHHIVHVPNATESLTLKWVILWCYVNLTSVRRKAPHVPRFLLRSVIRAPPGLWTACPLHVTCGEPVGCCFGWGGGAPPQQVDHGGAQMKSKDRS